MHNTEEQLEHCFAAVFPELSAERLRTAEADHTPGWDSTALVTLMSVVEEAFLITVDPEDLEQWTSFAAIHDYVRARTSA